MSGYTDHPPLTSFPFGEEIQIQSPFGSVFDLVIKGIHVRFLTFFENCMTAFANSIGEFV